MQYQTPEETAQQLKVGLTDIMSLIDQGKLRAIRIGTNIRIPETELDRLLVTCATGPTPTDTVSAESTEPLADNSRWCLTRMGVRFRVSGSVATGAEIWPGKMRYPIKFPKPFMDTLLVHFAEGEVAVGGTFDGPPPGSLGEFIQRELKTKMNPAVYLAALLIDEGHAVASRRGYIRLGRNVCPECGHTFKGNGFDGIDAHWKAKHEDTMPYKDAWPLIKSGAYERKARNS